MSRTVNQLLLRGASHHSRDAAFLHWDGRAWVSTPDWRADRHAVRIGLALRERFGVEAGDVVEIAIPLRLEFPLIERAVWGLGAISSIRPARGAAPVIRFVERAEGGSNRVPAIAFDDGSYDELLERGGVLDTPERATHFRAYARETSASAPASLDGSEAWTHGAWAEAIEGFQVRRPVAGARTLALGSVSPVRAMRIAVHSGFSDGRTTTAFYDAGAGSVPSGSVSLSLDGELNG